MDTYELFFDLHYQDTPLLLRNVWNVILLKNLKPGNSSNRNFKSRLLKKMPVRTQPCFYKDLSPD
jgi:hypothetical protein